jgi:DnaJ-class molecular chaperone
MTLRPNAQPGNCNWCHGTGKDRDPQLDDFGSLCRRCKGTGSVLVAQPAKKCATCQGTGDGNEPLSPCDACDGSGWALAS